MAHSDRPHERTLQRLRDDRVASRLGDPADGGGGSRLHAAEHQHRVVRAAVHPGGRACCLRESRVALDDRRHGARVRGTARLGRPRAQHDPTASDARCRRARLRVRTSRTRASDSEPQRVGCAPRGGAIHVRALGELQMSCCIGTAWRRWLQLVRCHRSRGQHFLRRSNPRRASSGSARAWGGSRRRPGTVRVPPVMDEERLWETPAYEGSGLRPSPPEARVRPFSAREWACPEAKRACHRGGSS